nr:MAG TPA: hypothetical protein [Caudoviricetes sp.]
MVFSPLCKRHWWVILKNSMTKFCVDLVGRIKVI